MVLIATYALISSYTYPVESACDFGWTSRGLFCYFVSTQNATFAEAVENCRQFESELLYIDDDLENEFVLEISAKQTGESYWIGYQHIIGTIWRWMFNGRVGNFQWWDIAEPDGQGDCARLTPYKKGAWRDYPCDLKQNFICKKLADCGVPPAMYWGAEMAYSRNAIPSLGNISIYSAGTLATYTCLTGFEFLDTTLSKQVECAVGGEWLPDITIEDPCIPKKCQTPPAFSNSVHNGTDVLFDFGTIVEYTCNAGYWFDQYSLGMSRSLYCANDKTWKALAGEEAPVDCAQVICQRPVTENAYANSSSNMKGTAVLYRCNRGHHFEDNSTEKVFVCGDDTWVPRPEKCSPVYCPDHQVEGAIPSTNDTVFDTLVIWRCEKGMLYPDTSTRKAMYCQENEKWDRVITDSCARMSCHCLSF